MWQFLCKLSTKNDFMAVGFTLLTIWDDINPGLECSRHIHVDFLLLLKLSEALMYWTMTAFDLLVTAVGSAVGMTAFNSSYFHLSGL